MRPRIVARIAVIAGPGLFVAWSLGYGAGSVSQGSRLVFR
jgi:hypothetical protein